MSQRIKVQDGEIHYSGVPSDSNLLGEVNVGVSGNINVSNRVTVGDINSPIDGIMTTLDGTALERAQLSITSGTYGDIYLYQSSTDGTLSINGVQWPSGVEIMEPGKFIGSTAPNKLEYMPFVLGAEDDTLSIAELNSYYPEATAGQYVTGTTLVYMCTGPSEWRILGGSPGEFITILSAPDPYFSDSTIHDNWNSDVQQTSDDCTVDDFSGLSPILFTLSTPGNYKVTIIGRVRPNNFPGDPLPNSPMSFGFLVDGAYQSFDFSTHQSGEAGAVAPWPTADVFQQQCQWTDIFYVNNSNGSQTFSVGAYATTNDELFQYVPGCIVSVVRTSGTPVIPV